MTRSALLRSGFAFTALLVSAFASSAPAQVVNGGFELGNLNGWTVVDTSNFTTIGNDPAYAKTGTYHANLGAFETIGSLSQTFATDAGGLYTLSFALANDSSIATNQFSIYWDGSLLLALDNLAGGPGEAYTTYTFDNLAASGSSTTLEFRYRNDDDFFRLDDVAVIAVPEASTISSVLLGAGLLCVVNYRRGKIRGSAAR